MFAIKHKETNKFFAGWNGNDAVWVADIKKAKAMNYKSAKSQALCFRNSASNINVQQKPVKIQ